jgi:hypothetical protein
MYLDSLLPEIVYGGVAQGQQDGVEGQAHQPQALLIRVQGQVVHAHTNNNNAELGSLTHCSSRK